MNIKLSWIRSGKIEKSYDLTYDGERVIITEVKDILKQAKRRFKVQGRQFIMNTGENVFYISKSRKDWEVFQV